MGPEGVPDDWKERQRGPVLPVLMLLIGAMAGVVIAALSLSRSNLTYAPEAVAIVNNQAINDTAYQRLLDALQSDKRSPLSSQDRQRVLDRMIDEELLVQRGVELGLVELNGTVRNTLIQAVTNAAVAEAGLERPTQEELREFYKDNQQYFTQPPRLQLELVYFSGTEKDSRERANAAYDELEKGAPFASIKSKSGDSAAIVIPDLPLPPIKIREYLGPSLLQTALALKPLQYSAPVAAGADIYILRVKDRIDSTPPEFQRIIEQIKKEYLRRRNEQVFSEYILWLRKRADIKQGPGRH